MVRYEPANSFETPRFSGVRTFMRLPNVQDLENADVHPVSGMVGDLEALALYAGQSVGLVARTQPAGEIVRDLADETTRTLEQGARLVEHEK